MKVARPTGQRYQHSALSKAKPSGFIHGILAEALYVGLLGSLSLIALEAARWLGR